jgi:hypothetical protein
MWSIFILTVPTFLIRRLFLFNFREFYTYCRLSIRIQPSIERILTFIDIYWFSILISLPMNIPTCIFFIDFLFNITCIILKPSLGKLLRTDLPGLQYLYMVKIIQRVNYFIPILIIWSIRFPTWIRIIPILSTPFVVQINIFYISKFSIIFKITICTGQIRLLGDA